MSKKRKIKHRRAVFRKKKEAQTLHFKDLLECLKELNELTKDKHVNDQRQYS